MKCDVNLMAEGMLHIEKNQERFLRMLIELVAVEAPTGCECARADVVSELFKRAGLKDVRLDSTGNVTGMWYGKRTNKYILIEAHMDTVFPFGTVTEMPKIEGNKIKCPGVTDNTVGVVNLVTVAETISKFNINTDASLLFAATVGEEGLGGLRGIKNILKDYGGSIIASVSVDGCGFEDIVYLGTGIRTLRFTVSGAGGHVCSSFRVVPQMLKTVSEISVKLSDVAVSDDEGTLLAVTELSAGTAENPHTMPSKANLTVNFRSNSSDELNRIGKEIDSIFMNTVDAENSKWPDNVRKLSVSCETLCDIPCGEQSQDSIAVQALYNAVVELKGKPRYAKGGCTNANVTISAGIPSVAVGTSNDDYKEHTTDEFIVTDNLHKCVQEVFMLALQLAGGIR